MKGEQNNRKTVRVSPSLKTSANKEKNLIKIHRKKNASEPETKRCREEAACGTDVLRVVAAGIHTGRLCLYVLVVSVSPKEKTVPCAAALMRIKYPGIN